MKKHLFIIVASLIAACVSLGCQNDSTENTINTKSASGQDIPSYLNVVSELKAGGSTEINLNDTDLDFSEMLTPGYKEYTVFYNEKESQYVIPVRYDPADEDIIDLKQKGNVITYSPINRDQIQEKEPSLALEMGMNVTLKSALTRME